MFWEHSPYSTNMPLIASVDEEETNMDDGVAGFFTRFGGNLSMCCHVGSAALSRGPRMR